MNYTLRLLSEARFVNFIRWLSGDGGAEGEAGLEATCICVIRHPDSGEQPFYAKLYPDMEGRSRALANEITGYVLANRFGLAQPAPACLVRVPLKHLNLPGAPRRHGWLRDLARLRPHYPAFCTQAIQAPTPWHHYGNCMSEALRQDLLRWPDVAKAMAFDEIITNLDRNLRNLLRIGPAQYAVIDHGRLVTPSGHWTAKDLDPGLKSINRLVEILHPNPALAANAMIAEAERNIALLAGLHEVQHWLQHLLPITEQTAFHQFLQARTIKSPEYIATRYALC